MNSQAQLAVTDALVFLLIVTVIASVSLMDTSGLEGTFDAYSAAGMKDYAEDTFIVLRRSTLDLHGCGLNLTQSVDMYVLSRTNAEDSLQANDLMAECDLLLHNLTRSLVLERYGFVLSSTYENETTGRLTKIIFGLVENASRKESFEVGWDYPMIGLGKPGEARICLEIWRRL